MFLGPPCFCNGSSFSKTRDGNCPISIGSFKSATSKYPCPKKRSDLAMSRDALSHDPRNGLEQEFGSSEETTTSRSPEPAGHVEGPSTNKDPRIDAERPQ